MKPALQEDDADAIFLNTCSAFSENAENKIYNRIETLQCRDRRKGRKVDSSVCWAVWLSA
jgi:tRNA A37 methylthiotransferase MiaB